VEGIAGKVLTIVKTQECPTGLRWKGETQYGCLVKVRSDDGGTSPQQQQQQASAAAAVCELCLSDSVIEEFIAQGTSCIALNKNLQDVRDLPNDSKEKLALKTFFQSFPKQFQKMRGRFTIEWPAGAGAGAGATTGMVVAFTQSQQQLSQQQQQQQQQQ
jgi:hypothetical protein